MQLTFQNVLIPVNRQLPGVKGFGSVATLLAESRLSVAQVAVGLGMGVYDFMMKYLKTREQFGNSLLSYQLVQDKIVKVMINVQSSLMLVVQAQRLME